MDKIVIGCIGVLGIFIAFILYSCVCVAGKIDKEIEEIQRKNQQEKVNNKG